jgi:4-amino-4-deoxy-L-arabinose transferase-like glycosyltransferase
VRRRPARIQQRRNGDRRTQLSLSALPVPEEPPAPAEGREPVPLRKRAATDLLVLAVLAGPLLFGGIGNHHIWPFDEAFVAEVAREMHVSGDLIVPTLGGRPFLEKPPLHYAAIDAAYGVFGVTPFAARLPSALAALFTLGVTYFLGRRLFERRIGYKAALLLPTLFLFLHAGHVCLIDATLVLFVTSAFLAAARARERDPGLLAILLLYGATALAFLTKGFVGPLMIALGLLANAVRERRRPPGRLVAHALGLAILLGSMGAWGAALHARGGAAFVREAFLANSVGRIVAVPGLQPADDSLQNHTLPVWALAVGLLGNVLPWTPLLMLAMLPERFRRARGAPHAGGRPWLDARRASGRAWLGTIVVVNVVALSCVHQKRGMFLLPLYPLMALLLALEVSRLRHDGAAASLPVRLLVAAQIAVASLLALLSVAALVVLPAWAHGRPPGHRALVVAAVFAIVFLELIVRAAMRWRAAGWATALRLAWALVLVSLTGAAVLLPHRMDKEISFAPFYRSARTIVEARGVTPVLASGNESFMGLADLSLERVLPQAIRKPDLMRLFASTGDLYVITKDLRLVDFGESARSEILVSGTSARRNPAESETLYLVHLTTPP